MKDPEPTHPLVKETYSKFSWKKDKEITTRKDSCLLAQIRTGHCRKLASYRHRLDPEQSPTCPDCEMEDQTTSHWMKCPALYNQRLNCFGSRDVGLGALTNNLAGSLAYARATLTSEL